MKKFFYILAAVAALAACSKETNINEDVNNQPAENGVKTVTFTATLESLDTKGTLSSSAFEWSATDVVGIWTSKGKKTATASNISIDGGSAEFTFTLADDETIAEGAILVYPAYRLSETIKDQVSLRPEVTDTPEASHGPILAAKVGSDHGTLSFKYVCGTVQATITDIPSIADIIYVQFLSGGCGGDSVISFSGDTPSVSGSGGDNVSIELSSGGSKTITLPVPVAGKQQFYFAVKQGNPELFYKTTPQLDVKRNSYFKMKDLQFPPKIYVRSFSGWSNLYAYVYYADDTYEAAWPGTQITSDYQAIPVSNANIGKKAHVILNAGNANLAKPFTRIETDEFTASASKIVTVSTVNQANMVLYFRDDDWQNGDWGEYFIYAWDNSDNKPFGAWPGTGKNSTIFSWREYSSYDQSNNWIASYTFTGKPAMNVILNNNSDKETGTVALEGGKDNWLVVSHDTKGTAASESFPTVSVALSN